eukprot:6645970-Pyramimonas_sp.AAC.1
MLIFIVLAAGGLEEHMYSDRVDAWPTNGFHNGALASLAPQTTVLHIRTNRCESFSKRDPRAGAVHTRLPTVLSREWMASSFQDGESIGQGT